MNNMLAFIMIRYRSISRRHHFHYNRNGWDEIYQKKQKDETHALRLAFHRQMTTRRMEEAFRHRKVRLLLADYCLLPIFRHKQQTKK